MGAPTLNVGTVEGGSGVNLGAGRGDDRRRYPDGARRGPCRVAFQLKKLTHGDAETRRVLEPVAVWTEPHDAWMQRVFEICKPILARAPEARTAPYMTDAANLRKVYAGAPTRGARPRRGGDGAPDRRVLQHGAHPPVGADLRGDHPGLD